MKISKYLHSCLLFEEGGYKVLFDPGKFSFAEGLVTPQTFAGVNSIVITHIHPDHYDPEILKSIVALSDATVFTNSHVGKDLDKAGIKYTVFEEGTQLAGPFKLQAFGVMHEPILDNPPPQMTGFLINDNILHPVDSMEDKLLDFKGIELLIMVTMAPFANELRISGFADKLQPKQILPVHDGYAKEFFIKQRYAAYVKHFEKQGIKFHEVYKAGDSISL